MITRPGDIVLIHQGGKPTIHARVEEILGTEQPLGVTGVRVKHVETGAEHVVPCDGVFVAIGHAPASDLVKDQVELHHGAYVKVKPGSTETSVPGVFAAGDLTDHVYRQAVTSAGMGCMAALDAERWLAAQAAAPRPPPGENEPAGGG
jgi:thioredoxin reductase (NADPH)